ncbi:hypothetical protein M758_12G155700 [Ceratodon purpureus]|uniref:Uncharacterized protein n=1 Tax=Ceratodon purpureus TaxID=3225 RepID=A0A8T0G7D2_CERPU|nr:hypothetical protein KC19_12G153500 [Ceratodon purpureus]KAG0599490.1 hypothetical protein M758_12G155700 [Ceratodon purpureus]
MITNKTVKVPCIETRFICCQKALRNSWLSLTARRLRNLIAKLEFGADWPTVLLTIFHTPCSEHSVTLCCGISSVLRFQVNTGLKRTHPEVTFHRHDPPLFPNILCHPIISQPNSAVTI